MIPFAGLSIIVHALIILIRKIIGKNNFNFIFSLIKKEIFSYLIIFFIFGAVMTNALFIIKSSVVNSPNIQLARELFSNQRVIAEISSDNNQTSISPEAGVESLDSIVDFLALNSVDSSFENRTLFAKKFGINNYIGSEEQNIELLSILKTGYF